MEATEGRAEATEGRAEVTEDKVEATEDKAEATEDRADPKPLLLGSLQIARKGRGEAQPRS